MTSFELNNQWEKLLEASKKSGNAVSVYINKKDKLQIGIGANGEKQLLCDKLKENIIDQDQFPLWKGMEFKELPNPDSQKYNYIGFRLKDPSFEDIFNALIMDIYSNINNVDDHSRVSLILSRIYKWYKFFKKNNIKDMSEKKQKGLLGELYFINNILFEHMSTKSAVSGWKGHSANHQDFSFSNANIEVKATSGKEHKKIYIHNEKQLDDTGLPNLYLYCVSFNRDSNNGISLPMIVDDIKQAIGEDFTTLNMFDTYLHNYGYLNEHEKYYNNNKFIFKNEVMFNVNSKFPRIIELPSGIGDIKYTINISTCENNLIKNITPKIEKLGSAAIIDTVSNTTTSTCAFDIIKQGENKHVEFKSTVRKNLHTNESDERMNYAVLKTINALMNTEGGGKLYIGVNDNGEIIGIDSDNFLNSDKMMLHISSIVGSNIGLQYSIYFDMKVISHKEKEILELSVSKSKKPTFLKKDNLKKFYIRSGPRTIELQGEEMQEYIDSVF